jgi:hypothetical protein
MLPNPAGYLIRLYVCGITDFPEKDGETGVFIPHFSFLTGLVLWLENFIPYPAEGSVSFCAARVSPREEKQESRHTTLEVGNTHAKAISELGGKSV